MLESERGLRPVAPGCEQPNGLVPQASKCVSNDSCRRGVEPLHIVDRNQNRTRTRERPNCSERPDRSLVRLNAIVWARLAAEERNFERVALRCRQGCEHRVIDACEEVDDRTKGEARFEFRRTAEKNLVRKLLRGADPCAPECRLADADRALQKEAARTRRDPRDELANGRKLGFPSDHPRSRPVQYWRHLPSIPRVSRIGKGGARCRRRPCNALDGATELVAD